MIGVFGWQQFSVEIGGGAALGKTHTGIDEKCAGWTRATKTTFQISVIRAAEAG